MSTQPKKKKRTYKFALSLLNNQLFSGVDGTGIMSSRCQTTCTNNQDNQDVTAPENSGD